jgi:hypothetical protein
MSCHSSTLLLIFCFWMNGLWSGALISQCYISWYVQMYLFYTTFCMPLDVWQGIYFLVTSISRQVPCLTYDWSKLDEAAATFPFWHLISLDQSDGGSMRASKWILSLGGFCCCGFHRMMGHRLAYYGNSSWNFEDSLVLSFKYEGEREREYLPFPSFEQG